MSAQLGFRADLSGILHRLARLGWAAIEPVIRVGTPQPQPVLGFFQRVDGPFTRTLTLI